MFWIILIIAALFLMTFLESVFGKIIAAGVVLAVGFLIIEWISGVALFITLAKTCAIIIVVFVVLLILAAIFG